MANLAIYRRYRPQKFSEFIGQEHIVQTLTNAIPMGLISHAYLFSGPRGSGKTTLARLLAKAMNCQNRKENEFEPCNKCSSCLEITQGNAMDLIEIDAASHRGIDEIRELRDKIGFLPAKSKYKIFVIDECLTGDHFISMADGTVKNISEINNRDKILSIDVNTGEIVEKSVSNFFKRKTDKIIEIKTPQALIKVTPSHKLWILRDGEFLLKEARDVKLGDFLLSPVSIPHFQKNNLTPEQLGLLAIIQCDGHIYKNLLAIQIEIRKDAEYFEKKVKDSLKEWRISKNPTIKKTLRGTRLIRIYSKKFSQILTNLGCPAGKKSTKIDIPDAVFQAPINSIKAYIDACFCCEGDVIPFGYPGNINYRLNFTSGSEIFVKKLQLLLKKLDIGSNIIKIKKRNKKHSTLHRLSVSGYNLRLFCSKIGLSLERKNKLLKEYLQKKEKQDSIPIEKLILEIRREKGIKYSELIPYGIYPACDQHLTRKSVLNFIKVGGLPELNKYLRFRYEKIKKIEIKNKITEVYDFTVKNTHTFIADGICSSNCHQLTKEAANALLKTLEEPPSHVIFILATTEAYKMIPTIVSRCQRFDFKKLTFKEIVKKLKLIAQGEKINFDKFALSLIAQNAEGSLRDAESLMDQSISFFSGKKEISTQDLKDLLGILEISAISKFVDCLLEKNPIMAISFLEEQISQGLNLEEFAKSVISYLRKTFLFKMNPDFFDAESSGLAPEEFKKMSSQASSFNEKELERLLEILIEAENKMKYSSIPQLPLELAVISFIHKEA